MKEQYTAEERAGLKELIIRWKETGAAIIFTNGCFDLLHHGHIALLAYAKEQGGKVLVGLNSDGSVKRLKGESRPFNSEQIRAKNLLKTGNVDAVAIFKEDTPLKLISQIEPDILIKGDDYDLETTVGATEVMARGGKVLFFKKIPGLSTSNLIGES